MATTIRFEEQVEIPLGLGTLAEFRAWATSDAFPEQGRIDYLSGSIEVDMSPEDLFCHGALKVELIRVLSQRVKSQGLGHLFTDRTRVSVPAAELSVEPDIVFLSTEARSSGRVRLVPKERGRPGRYVELEGPPDLVVEIVSDASVTKDTRRLPEAYARARIPEFWLADARGSELVFRIHHLAESAYVPAATDAEGFQRSPVFGALFRLDGRRDEQGEWVFDLREKDA